MTTKVSIIEDDHFRYLCLNAFTNWDDYDLLLNTMEQIPSVNFKGEPIEGPYSKYIDFFYEGVSLTLMYHDEIGNCIRMDKSTNVDELTQTAMKFCKDISKTISHP